MSITEINELIENKINIIEFQFPPLHLDPLHTHLFYTLQPPPNGIATIEPSVSTSIEQVRYEAVSETSAEAENVVSSVLREVGS